MSSHPCCRNVRATFQAISRITKYLHLLNQIFLLYISPKHTFKVLNISAQIQVRWEQFSYQFVSVIKVLSFSSKTPCMVQTLPFYQANQTSKNFFVHRSTSVREENWNYIKFSSPTLILQCAGNCKNNFKSVNVIVQVPSNRFSVLPDLNNTSITHLTNFFFWLSITFFSVFSSHALQMFSFEAKRDMIFSKWFLSQVIHRDTPMPSITRVTRHYSVIFLFTKRIWLSQPPRNAMYALRYCLRW